MQTIYAFSYNPVIATGTNTTGTNWRMAYQQPIMLYKGTSNLFRLVVFSVKQKVVDLTNYGVQVQIVDKETKEHFVTKTATITTPTSGVATIEFTEEDLRNLQHRFYHLIAKLIDPDDGSSVSSGEILYLDDNYGAFTPITIEDAWNYSPTSISTVDGIPAISFTNIGETPDTFVGQADKILKVNASETSIEFSTSVSSLTIGNTLFSDSNLTTNNSSMNFRVNSQILSFTDNSTDFSHNEGDGGFLTFFDNTHIDDGPRFEIWYGEQDNPNDPAGQHSLDIRAADANSYVELASYNLDSFIGIDGNGPFIQTQWQDNPSKAWRFLGDGELRVPTVGSKISTEDGLLSIGMNFEDIRISRVNRFTNEFHTTVFDGTGDVYFDGDLLPGVIEGPDLTPQHSLGTADRPWKDLYVSNSTIYLGDVALSVDQSGNLLVDGNVITGGGGVGPVQPYLELTNYPFIIRPAILGEPITVTAANQGNNARFTVVISEGPTIDSITITTSGTGYTVGQRYRIWSYYIGGPNDASSIDFEVATVGENGELLTITDAAFLGEASNTPGTYTNAGAELLASVFDEIDEGLILTRDRYQGIYNSALEQEYDNNTYTSPLGTEWNSDGWETLTGIGLRDFTTWRSALNNAVGDNILDSELVMHDIANDKYYKFDFTQWGGSNGGYSYTRREITDPNYFKKTDYGNEVDVIVDDSTAQVGITRGNNNGIYNPFTEEGWNSNVSPEGTLWNIDGWNDLSNLTTRTYTNLYAAFDGNLGNKIVGTECIMYVASIEKYYAVKFLSWTQGGNGGGFSYVRYEIDQTKLNEGIKFADGTVLKSAAGIGRVKSTASGNRRIEEVVGSNTVTVTEKTTVNLTSVASRSVVNDSRFWVANATTTIDEIVDSPSNYGITDYSTIQFSLDNNTWYSYTSGYSGTGTEIGVDTNGSHTYNEGDTIYFRYGTGGAPQVWWNKNDLPGGATDFRGAVIDYHAYSGEATWIGTIHIVDDSGEEHITHTEVMSGTTDGENDDLWVVQNEGTISYRRIDGEAKTLKVHWTAKVFYGSEYYD